MRSADEFEDGESSSSGGVTALLMRLSRCSAPRHSNQPNTDHDVDSMERERERKERKKNALSFASSSLTRGRVATMTGLFRVDGYSQRSRDLAHRVHTGCSRPHLSLRTRHVRHEKRPLLPLLLLPPPDAPVAAPAASSSAMLAAWSAMVKGWWAVRL